MDNRTTDPSTSSESSSRPGATFATSPPRTKTGIAGSTWRTNPSQRRARTERFSDAEDLARWKSGDRAIRGSRRGKNKGGSSGRSPARVVGYTKNASAEAERGVPEDGGEEDEEGRRTTMSTETMSIATTTTDAYASSACRPVAGSGDVGGEGSFVPAPSRHTTSRTPPRRTPSERWRAKMLGAPAAGSSSISVNSSGRRGGGDDDAGSEVSSERWRAKMGGGAPAVAAGTSSSSGVNNNHSNGKREGEDAEGSEISSPGAVAVPGIGAAADSSAHAPSSADDSTTFPDPGSEQGDSTYPGSLATDASQANSSEFPGAVDGREWPPRWATNRADRSNGHDESPLGAAAAANDQREDPAVIPPSAERGYGPGATGGMGGGEDFQHSGYAPHRLRPSSPQSGYSQGGAPPGHPSAVEVQGELMPEQPGFDNDDCGGGSKPVKCHQKRGNRMILVLVALLVVAGAVTAGVLLSGKTDGGDGSGNEKSDIDHVDPTPSPTEDQTETEESTDEPEDLHFDPTPATNEEISIAEQDLVELVCDAFPPSCPFLESDPASSGVLSVQRRAVQWLASHPPAYLREKYSSDDSKLARYSLATLYLSTTFQEGKEMWMEPMVDVCEWEGVDCTNEGKVQILDVGGFMESGTVPAELAILGESLEELYMQKNGLEGPLPIQLSLLNNLEVLSVNENKLSGDIPLEFGELQSLQTLRVHSNQFDGSVPDEICGLSRTGMLQNLWADCLGSDGGRLKCGCCSHCCNHNECCRTGSDGNACWFLQSG